MSLRLTLDVREIDGLDTKLRRLTGEAFGLAASTAVNEVITRFEKVATRGMNEGINLSDQYVKSKTDLVLSRAGTNPEATLTTRGDLTILGHYDPIVLYRSAPRARGDSSRGVPAGARAAGVSVEVTRGSRKSMQGAFTMKLRQGTKEGDKVGVFIRSGDRKKHVYGVAPYSLFRFQVNKRADDLEVDLENTAASVMVNAVERALA